MTITTYIAYLLVFAYLIIERVLRKDLRPSAGGASPSRSLNPQPSDRNSSYLLWFVGLLNLIAILLAPFLNHHDLFAWHNPFVGWLGIALMLSGLSLRYAAAKTLGAFYTRTLQIIEDHQVVTNGPYRIIRHPGYLGVLLIDIGAGLAVHNWLALLIVSVSALLSKLYRIRTEEDMLSHRFGEQYYTYAQETWRLLPFLY